LKRIVVLLLLAGVGYTVYRVLARAGPVRAYEKFADAWARGDDEIALRHAEGDAMRRTLRSHSIRGLLFHPMEAFHGTRYAIDSVTSSPEGDVVIAAKQTIGFDPPGVTSAVGGAMFAVFRHQATLHKTSEGWKITAFEPTFLEAGETRRR
jgi:hypothetical protein